MAQKEIYKLEVNVSVDDGEAQKKLSSMDKYFQKTEKRAKQLDRLKVNPSAKVNDKATSAIRKIEGNVKKLDRLKINPRVDLRDNATPRVKTATRGIRTLDRTTANPTAELNDRTSDGTQRAQSSLNELDRTSANPEVNLTDNASSRLDEITKKMAAVGKTMSKAVTAPVVAFGVASVKTFLGFDDSMRKVGAITTATDTELKDMTATAEKLGATTAHSSTAVAEAMTNLGTAGYSANEIISATPGLLNLASAGSLELADASGIVTDTLNQFQLKAKDAGRASDVFAKASASSGTDVAQLGEAMKYAGGAANSAGMSIEQTSAVLGVLGDNGIKGSQGGTTFTAMLTNMKDKAENGAIAIGKTSVALYDLDGNARDLGSVMADVESATEGMSGAQKDAALSAIFGTQAMKGVNAMLASGSDRYNELESAMYGAEGTAKKMAEQMESGIGGSMREMKSAIEAVAIAFGRVLAPGISNAAKYIADAALKFKDLSVPAKKMIIIFAGIAAAIGPTLIVVAKTIGMFKKLKAAFLIVKGAVAVLAGALSWPIVAIVALIAIGIALYKNWDKVKEKASQLGSAIKDKWNEIKESTSQAWENIKTSISDKWNGIKESVTSKISEVKESITSAWDGIKDKTSNAWESVKTAVSNSITSLKEKVTAILSTLGEIFSKPLERIKESATKVLEGVKNVFMGAFEAIKNVVLGAILIITDIITGDFESIGSHLSQIWENIKQGFSQMWEGVIQVFTGAGEFLRALMSLTWDAIVLGIQTAWSSTVEFLSGVWASITASAIEGWNSLKEGVSSIITSTVEWIKTTWNSTVEWFSTLPGRLLAAGTAMFTALLQGIASMAGAVRAKATEIGNSTVDTLKNIPGKMLSIGSDIVQGLINGLGAKLGALKAKAQEVANSVKDSIKGALNIHSPSRVMIELGEFTTEGLGIGMVKKKPSLEKATNAIYKTVADKKVSKQSLSKLASGSASAKVGEKSLTLKQTKESKEYRPFVIGGGSGNNAVSKPNASPNVNYNMDIDVDVDFDGKNNDGNINEVVDEAQKEFGRKLLEALKDKK